MEVDHVRSLLGSLARRPCRHSATTTTITDHNHSPKHRPSSSNDDKAGGDDTSQQQQAPPPPQPPTEPVVVIVEAAAAADGDLVTQELQQFVLGFDRGVSFEGGVCGCRLCGRALSDPRVLPCLHSFCAACLEKLLSLDNAHPHPQTTTATTTTPGSPSSAGAEKRQGPLLLHHSRSGSTASSSDASPAAPPPEAAASSPAVTSAVAGAGRLLQCPACGHVSRVPAGGVSALPVDFVAQHRTVLASLNRDSTRLLCDTCPGEQTATWRCSECMVNLCDACRSRTHDHPSQLAVATASGDDPSSSGGGAKQPQQPHHHEVLSVAEARRRGITRVRRQLMCHAHPHQELKLFCGACARLVCSECTQGSGAAHRGHSVQPVARAATARSRAVKEALERARPTAERGAAALAQLQQVAQQIQTRCSVVQSDVDRFAAAYAAALEHHRRALRRQARDAADAKLAAVRAQARRLERVAVDACAAVAFTDLLLKEGSEAEVLSLSGVVLRRLQTVGAAATADGGGGGLRRQLLDAPRCVSQELTFLATESAGMVRGFPLVGVVSTQAAVPARCTLQTPLQALMECQVHKRTEVIVQTRDADGVQLSHGGERIGAELRHRDAYNTKVNVHVADRRDGTYSLAFVPETPGRLALSVTVHNAPIQGSPFPVHVRVQKAHQGQYHCCCFCSSGGSREATCGCGATMPGGYSGCGHGHLGHPGRRHWSCCGNVLENSECSSKRGRSLSAAHYQFTL